MFVCMCMYLLEGLLTIAHTEIRRLDTQYPCMYDVEALRYYSTGRSRRVYGGWLGSEVLNPSAADTSPAVVSTLLHLTISVHAIVSSVFLEVFNVNMSHRPFEENRIE